LACPSSPASPSPYIAQESTRQTIAEICRRLGVSEQTFYWWKKKFGAMGVAEVRRLK
jgi:putative transposase